MDLRVHNLEEGVEGLSSSFLNYLGCVVRSGFDCSVTYGVFNGEIGFSIRLEDRWRRSWDLYESLASHVLDADPNGFVREVSVFCDGFERCYFSRGKTSC